MNTQGGISMSVGLQHLARGEELEYRFTIRGHLVVGRVEVTQVDRANDRLSVRFFLWTSPPLELRDKAYYETTAISVQAKERDLKHVSKKTPLVCPDCGKSPTVRELLVSCTCGKSGMRRDFLSK